MKRRTLLGAAGLLAAPAVAQPDPTSQPLPLEQLREQYRYDLFEDFLPFMDRHVIDRQYGGFMCNTDRDGTNLSGRKETWSEGRGIWVYSFLYNHFGRHAHHLEVARRSVEFILRATPADKDQLWPVSFTQERNSCAAAVASAISPFAGCTQLSQWPQGCPSVSPK